MLLLTTLTLSLLAYLNYRIHGQTILHPAVAFCSTWAGGLLLIWMVGSLFYPLAPETLLVFLGGSVAFCTGSAWASLYPPPARSERNAAGESPPPSNWILNALVLVVLCATPFAVRWMINAASQHPGLNYFGSASQTIWDDTLKGDPGFVLFNNTITLGNIAALLAFAERQNHRTRWLTALFLAITLNVVIAGRSGIVVLIFSILAVDWIQNRHIRWKLLMAMGAVFLILVTAIAIFLGKAGANPQASLADNAAPVARGLALYAVGGVVAFDRVLQQPGVIPRDTQISLFFVQTLNKFGAHLPLPNTTAGFLDVGPGLTTNVYTIYFSYLDMGYLPTMGMLILLGFVLTRCYNQALVGSRISAVMYATLWSGVILSLFAEFFFDSLNFLLKLYLLSWLVYSLPATWRSFNAFISHAVNKQLRDVRRA